MNIINKETAIKALGNIFLGAVVLTILTLVAILIIATIKDPSIWNALK